MQDNNLLTIYDMGKWLELRRSNNTPTILLLGSRAGALYRSLTFYHYLLQNAPQQFYTRSPIRSFRDCYDMLIRNSLGERELHTLLQDSLKHVATLFDIPDVCCAELIKRGYFREVISTNIDDLVERALLRVGLIEGKDFEVCIPDKQSLSPKRDLPYRLTKIFGDLHSRTYAIDNRQSFLAEQENLKQYLQALLSRDVLAVGIDTLWDESILPFLQHIPHSLWFVNEDEAIISDQQIVSLLKQPKTAEVIHSTYDYKEVWRLLYQQLCKENILRDTPMHPSQFASTRGRELDDNPFSTRSPTTHKNDTIRVFYIYCDDDFPLMQKFWQQLSILKHEHLITEWHRGLLAPGDHLQLTQERELRRAQLIFVGFSPQFLSSEYHDQAIQALKLSHGYGGTVPLVPLRLRPIGNWKLTQFSNFAALPREDKALSEFSSNDLDRELSKIADEIRDLVVRLKNSEA